MADKTGKAYKDTYTKPQLREQLKNKIKHGSQGGKAGQWSARKAQLLTKKYEAQGGDYKHKGQKTASQKNLSKWTKKNNSH